MEGDMEGVFLDGRELRVSFEVRVDLTEFAILIG